MKLIRAMSMAALLMALSAVSFAATKTITVTEPVTVGSTVLKPGDYHVTWNGTGPNVKVEFKSGKKAVATATATVEQSKQSSDALELGSSGANNAKTLHAIDFKNEKLVFGNAPAAGGQ